MGMFGTKIKSSKYHAKHNNDWSEYSLRLASDADLLKWSNDPDCIEKDDCARYLAERQAEEARVAEELQKARGARRKRLQEDPFDPRTDVSADAKKIVFHLWMLLFVVPLVIGIVVVLVAAGTR